MMRANLNVLIGQKLERRYMNYTWRDISLYAIAVGAGEDDLLYTYEKNMKTLPTFGVTPYWGTVNVRPHLPRPYPAAQIAEELIGSTLAPLHMEHELVMHRPIDPIKGTFVFQDVITDVFDRGAGKGAVIKTQSDIHDEAGNLLCSNISTTLFQEGGGFGGAPLPKSEVVIPNRPADIQVDDYISPIQNILYRLTGDTNLVHVDSLYAKEHGFDQVFMQGLCSFGFACRMAIGALIPGHPEQMQRIGAQMRAIAYMDTPIRLMIWRIEPGKAFFRLLDMNKGTAILDRGVFEWQPID